MFRHTFAILFFLPLVVHAEEKAPLFETDIRPILKAHCFECHGDAKKPKAGLDVRLKRLLVEGGDNGPSIVVGKSKEGTLIEKLRSGEMPPGKKKLSPTEIGLIARWIDQGAKTARAEPDKLAAGFHITEEELSFWYFQPLSSAKLPVVKNAKLVRTPIDAFLLEKLEAAGLSFSAEADRTTLLRRASFDLLGLPPTPTEVDRFLKDTAPDAWEQAIDRLLASPHYGERWARHWLDVVGYADSEGVSGQDPVRASAFRYRDYVIRSMNEDKPFDQFIHEQLAGDEMVSPPYTKLDPKDFDKLIATGFLRMAPDGTASKDADMKVATNQNIADTIQIVSASLLGLTVQCAQCHDHRYDPIPQTDYYKMRAIFEPALDWKNWRLPAAREIPTYGPEAKKKADEIEAQAVVVDQERVAKVKVFVKTIFDKAMASVPADKKEAVAKALKLAGSARSPEQKELLAKYKGLLVDNANVVTFDEGIRKEVAGLLGKAAKIRATKPAIEGIRALTEVPGQTPPTFLFDRGDPDSPKEELLPGHLAILASFNLPEIPAKDAKRPTTGRRLAFAKALTSDANPLTPRALVNRFWMHHFGKGISGNPSDLGFLGERPSHPELLDWLARDFTASGWRLKRFHKQILMSTAYRQSSFRSPESQERDPDNRLLSRMSLRRLEAETLRDAMLAVNGKLNAKMFGAPIPIRPDDSGQIVIGVDTNDNAGRPTGKVVPLNGEEFRRSIYVQVRRSKPLAMLETFDGPILNPNCDLRNVSTVTPQSLLLMNSRGVQEMAEDFARRVDKEADIPAKVRLAWKLAFAIEPTAQEMENAAEFIAEQRTHFARQKDASDPAKLALANFCQAILSSNRFLYID